jgi:hypothetical protein
MKQKKKTRKQSTLRKEELSVVNGQFPLNPNNSDRLSFSAVVDVKNIITIINNVSYEMSFEKQWEWIIRYDDHGGIEAFHRHERLYLEDDSNLQINNIIEHSTKQKLLEWSINDIKVTI